MTTIDDPSESEVQFLFLVQHMLCTTAFFYSFTLFAQEARFFSVSSSLSVSQCL